MKKLLIAVSLLLGLSAMAHSNSGHKDNTYGHHKKTHSPHNTHKKRKAHYVKATRCSPKHKRIKRHPHRRQQYLKQHTLVYKNITFWHDQNMVRHSGRVLHKTRINRRDHSRNCTKRH